MLTAQQVYTLAVSAVSRLSTVTVTPHELSLLLTALAEKESTFRPEAKNRGSTARGLTQILICTQREIERQMKIPYAPASERCSKLAAKEPVVSPSDDKMYDPRYALLLAAFYLHRQIVRYNGDIHRGLHAYNQGSYDAKKPKAAGESYAKDLLRRRDRLRGEITEIETVASDRRSWPAYV